MQKYSDIYRELERVRERGDMDETGVETTAAVAAAVESKRMKVLVAIDESEGSMYALKWALDKLFPTIDVGYESHTTEPLSTLILLHVQHPFQHYIFTAGSATYATPGVVESVRKAQEENSAILLSQSLDICRARAKPLKVESVVMSGDPKEMICQVAEQMQCDLIVVGSRGLSKLKRAFLGSVSDYCAHHANCPILIVKPPK